ncbi:MAG: hypothetical protein JWQ55_3420 [Rhodopila sp.]|jgi:hypothetical protein|nr:hypothetical protein [Rhodopila sp.]
MFPDDIPDETPASDNERSIKRDETSSRRKVGPESEARGGPETVDETLDDNRLQHK